MRGERAVECRVLAIKQEYKTAAATADERYYGTDTGPITQRLSQMVLTGVAFGCLA